MGIIEYKSNKKLLILILVASLFINACAAAQPNLKPVTIKKTEVITLDELVKFSTNIDLVIFLKDSTKLQGNYDGFVLAESDNDSTNTMLVGDLYLQTSAEIIKISSNDIVKILYVTEHYSSVNLAQNVLKIYFGSLVVIIGATAVLFLIIGLSGGCLITC
ncbi:MAG: hypothetical protein IIB41_01035 [Candidatus Marinimicrobia bacterium]|nr:hypothetical protein [Candidatus Neomarinimicrobiota bacterium]